MKEKSLRISGRNQAKAGYPYIYVVGANGTAVIDPTNWQLNQTITFQFSLS